MYKYKFKIMSKDKFLLHEKFKNPLNKEEFIEAKKLYLEFITTNEYEIKATKDIFQLIQNIKRSPEKIGPYQNMSVFEALNRIGSDLVLLSGAEKLFTSEIPPENILLRMGNTQGFDFEVLYKGNKKVYGEAFNAAKSFCKHKMRQAIDKLVDKNPDKKATSAIIFINEEMKGFLENYKNKKETKNEKTIKIQKIYCNVNLQKTKFQEARDILLPKLMNRQIEV